MTLGGLQHRMRRVLRASALAHWLVSGELKARRLAQWVEFARQYPQGYLYCWRGGLRSETVQTWLREAGIEYPRVIGGYKAMRRFLLDELEYRRVRRDPLHERLPDPPFERGRVHRFEF